MSAPAAFPPYSLPLAEHHCHRHDHNDEGGPLVCRLRRGEQMLFAFGRAFKAADESYRSEITGWADMETEWPRD